MAYVGGIRFLDKEEVPYGRVRWTRKLHYDTSCNRALIADVGNFQHCTMELNGNRHAVFDLSRRERGWICYDVEDGKNILEEHCVVVGSTEYSEYYYILVVKPTDVDDEYKRVGMGKVSKNCLVKMQVNVRVA
jgi:hypothetical protein